MGRLRALAWLLAAVAFAGGVVASANGASSSVVVTMDVVSSTELTDNCTASAAHRFGSVVPGTPALTATGANVCSISFSSTNGTARLAMGQKDGAGRAMGAVFVSDVKQKLPTGVGVTSIDAYDATRAYATLENALVMRTTDGGSNWTSLGTSAVSTPYDITHAPADPNVWYATGLGPNVQKTVNGLAATPTWTDLTPALIAGGWPASGPDRTPQAIGCATTLICWVVGEDGWIGKTTNGGTSWSVFQHATVGTADWNAIAVVDANTAFLAGESGWLARTTTGGGNQAAWTTTNTSGTWWYAIAAQSASSAYAGGNNGDVVSWNGTTWTNRRDAVQGMYDVGGVAVDPSDPAKVWVAFDDGLLRTSSDSGATWTTLDTAAGRDFRAIDAPTSSELYLAANGSHVQRSSDGGATWAVASEDAGSARYYAVAADPTDGQRAVAMDGDGAIDRTIDGGATWTPVASPVTEPIFDAQFGTQDVGWAVGDQGTIINTIDGGASWQAQSSGTTVRLSGVWAESATTAYAAGEQGTVLRTTDGGASWTSLTTGTTRYLQDVTSTGTGVVIAVGRKGKMIRSTDGGDTFASVGSLPSSSDLENPVALDAGVVYVIAYNAGGGGDTWRSADSGATWTSLPNTAGVNMAHFDIAADGHPWGGQYSQIAHSIDDWATTTIDFVSGENVEAIEAIDANAAYVVGGGHLITRYNASNSANKVINDYTPATYDWASGSATSLFGWCLQDVAGLATVDAAWTEDADGTCTATDGPEWAAVPATAQRVAYTSVSGDVGQVDVVWGVRPKDNQTKGTYTATVVFEVLSPNV
ncbi:MAG: hypothetical protein KDC46_05670 [Thermoleophilia bacterium]|nr:hypothetical protein [Thermoleophilia bacterium]